MSDYLLDTHVLVWAKDTLQMLTPETRDLLVNPVHRKWVSVASLWEMAIKINLGKMKPLPKNFLSSLREDGVKILDVSSDHALAVQHLPLFHRDPFDRMLVAQAKIEKLTIITRDSKIVAYDVATVRA